MSLPPNWHPGYKRCSKYARRKSARNRTLPGSGYSNVASASLGPGAFDRQVAAKLPQGPKWQQQSRQVQPCTTDLAFVSLLTELQYWRREG